jgi:thiamine-monophosphate kinase
MGCHQVLGITVALIAPAATPWSWVEGVYQGIQQALLRHGGVLLGGDCSAGLQRMLAITALGTLPGEAGEGGGIHRGDGRPGDLLVSTGPHGLSRLGLALLLGDRAVVALNPCLPEALVQQAVAAHRRPVPRFDAVRLLGRCRPPRLPWRVAGCDSSDGLAAAVRALALASGCGARLERSRLPMAPAMGCLPEAELWCLSGGEDFELVLALDPGWAQRLVAMLPGASVIGWLEECSGGEAVRWAGSGEPLGQQGGGFLHFR